MSHIKVRLSETERRNLRRRTIFRQMPDPSCPVDMGLFLVELKDFLEVRFRGKARIFLEELLVNQNTLEEAKKISGIGRSWAYDVLARFRKEWIGG